VWDRVGLCGAESVRRRLVQVKNVFTDCAR